MKLRYTSLEPAVMTSRISTGFVTFYPDTPNYKVLLLDHGSHISHPKGHQEKGETKLHAARRELKEETNLTAEIVSDTYLSSHSYTIERNGKSVSKQVFLYAAITNAGSIVISNEHQSYYLVDIPKARTLLTYQGDVDALQKAENWLTSRQ